jgi:hypothetical protein
VLQYTYKLILVRKKFKNLTVRRLLKNEKLGKNLLNKPDFEIFRRDVRYLLRGLYGAMIRRIFYKNKKNRKNHVTYSMFLMNLSENTSLRAFQAANTGYICPQKSEYVRYKLSEDEYRNCEKKACKKE